MSARSGKANAPGAFGAAALVAVPWLAVAALLMSVPELRGGPVVLFTGVGCLAIPMLTLAARRRDMRLLYLVMGATTLVPVMLVIVARFLGAPMS